MSAVLKSPATPEIDRRTALKLCGGIVAGAAVIAIQIRNYLSTIVKGANAIGPGGGADNSPLNDEPIGFSGDFHQMPGWRVTVAAIPPRRFDPSPAITIRLDNIDPKRKHVVGLGLITSDLNTEHRDVDDRVDPDKVELIRTLVVSAGGKEHSSIQEIYDFIISESGGNNPDKKNAIIIAALQNWLLAYDKRMGSTGVISNGNTEPLTQTSLQETSTID